MLEQVEGDETGRVFAQDPRRHAPAPDARLQPRERRRMPVSRVPDEDLAVEHGAVGQARRRLDDLREALANQFLAP